MTATDLLKFNPCNLDHLTETYGIGFYLEYFTKWPHLCKVIEGANGQIEAYSEIRPHYSLYSRGKANNTSSPRQSGILTISSPRGAL